MATPIFITGIGTNVGKTIASAIVAQALEADYWKPIQAGFNEGTDKEMVTSLLSNPTSIVHNEVYKLQMPASPHIAAKNEGVVIDIQNISDNFFALPTYNRFIIVEGAGGLLVPLNENEFVADLILKLQSKVILVSRNYLGSINHSLLTAEVCRQRKIDVVGWLFNDNYLDYENEIAAWSGYTNLLSIPFIENVTPKFIAEHAARLAPVLKQLL